MTTALAALLMTQLPLPTPRQIAWHQMEYYAFVHFGPNTFTGREWGEGNEDPNKFNPTELDCRQWVRTFKAAGMKGVIITAKHHDGFCLWPSQFSSHTVAQSKWRDGKGDVLHDLSAACKAEGLKMGVYLSPWDRNHPNYGTPEYNQTFANTLTEVLTRYGTMFEVWFDGANGEGPNGKRQVYDFPKFHSVVRQNQPMAVMFSDAGPDIRWVGNESGVAGDPCWYTVDNSRYVPGTPRYHELTNGDMNGPDWVPAECDVSIRPGWFWRASENDKVKTPEQLLDLYLKSVGRGSSLLLNVPPDTRGLIHENDVKALLEFRKLRDSWLGRDLGHRGTWDGLSRTLRFSKPMTIDAATFGERIEKGQRIRRFSVEALVDGKWLSVASGESVGRKRICVFDPVRALAVRIQVESSIGDALLSRPMVHRKPGR